MLTTEPLGDRIRFRPAVENDFDFLYALHRATMKEYVNKTWGWVDAVQETRFRKNYIPSRIQIITLVGNNIGMISVEETDEETYLHVIEIHPTYQQQGLGTAIIQKIIEGLHAKRNRFVCKFLRSIQPNACMTVWASRSSRRPIHISS